jgi:hypothetical protein
MKRRLAVPIALRSIETHEINRLTKVRNLRPSNEDSNGYSVWARLAENHEMIERLQKSIDLDPQEVDCHDIVNELEFLRADIEIGLTEIEAEIEDLPSSEEILTQELAFA